MAAEDSGVWPSGARFSVRYGGVGRRATRKSCRAGLVITVALAGAACSLAPAAYAARSVPQPPLRGFDTASPGLGFPIPGGPLKDLERAKMLGSNAVRVTLRWEWLEPQEGGLNETRAKKIDRVVAKARKRGLGVVFTLLSTPCWASSAPRSILGGLRGRCTNAGVYPPRNATTYGNFVKRIVKRWGAGLAGVEVWNEPNVRSFWQGSVGDYMQLVQQAHRAVNATRFDRVAVVGASVGGGDLAYLKQLFDAGIAGWTDAIAIHPYDIRFFGPGFGDPSVVRPDDIWSFAWVVPQVHALMNASGVQDPLWITEFGYSDCPALPYCVSSGLQADYLAKAVRLAATWPYVDAFLIYRLRDWGATSGSTEARFGVLRKNGTRKPAAESVAKAFKSLR